MARNRRYVYFQTLIYIHIHISIKYVAIFEYMQRVPRAGGKKSRERNSKCGTCFELFSVMVEACHSSVIFCQCVIFSRHSCAMFGALLSEGERERACARERGREGAEERER